jgi:LCP family protein required for cell wall assembly
VSLLARTRGGALWRFLLGAVLVIGFTAATTAVAGLLQFKSVVDDLNLSPALKNARVTLPPTGAPQTLLLIGSDHRAGEPYSAANTDTMMLVRIDDSSSTINVLSIPRDLAVNLPQGGTTYEGKLNAAYSIGGPNLLIKILQQQVFPGLQVNHILDVNFAGFSDLIDAIGCVYADVDHRYYNNTALTDYSSIDIEPGYQRLCGDNQSISGALAFVRFRHTDSDEVRNARQQDFLRWAKDGYNSSQLLSNESKLLHIFGEHVETDKSLHTTDGLINLFDLVINADGHTVKTVPFPEYFGNCTGGGQTPCYVYADGSGPQGGLPVGHGTPQESQALKKLLTPTLAKPPAPASPAVTPAGPKRPGGAPSPFAGLTADPGDGRSQAAQLGNVGMPVYYPRYIMGPTASNPGGSAYCFSITANCDDPSEPHAEYAHSYPRRYLLREPDGARVPAYVMTLVINSALGDYYTVQGTTWQHPSILSGLEKVQVVAGKKLFEYGDGGKVALVAFHTAQGLYWISNTLENSIPAAQMVGIAASMTQAP